MPNWILNTILDGAFDKEPTEAQVTSSGGRDGAKVTQEEKKTSLAARVGNVYAFY